MSLKSFSSFLSVIALIFVLSGCSSDSDTGKSETAKTATDVGSLKKQEVTPPFKQIDVPFQKFEIEPNKAYTLHLKNGTTLEIPEGAFVNADGKSITQSIELNYREFHNPAEIIASGIPMRVNGANGEEAWMQTAGMFEIKGTSNDQPVFLAPDRGIVVNMASQVDGDYDFWYFDPGQGNWENKGQGSASKNAERMEAVQKLTSLQARLPEAPVKPVEFDKTKPSLNFEVDYTRFTELEKMKGLIWQYAGADSQEDPAENPWVFQKEWEQAELDATNTPGKYRLTLVAGDTEYSIPVCPSRSGKDLDQAKADYQKKLKEYEAVQKMIQNKKALVAQQAEFLRRFQVQQFGIHNWDILWKMRGNIPLAANFDFGNFPAPMKKMITIYLITGDQRTIVKFPYEQWDSFAFNPETDNCIMAVLPGNKIATFSQKDFAEQMQQIKKARGGTYNFRMNVEKDKMNTIEEIQEKIKILS